MIYIFAIETSCDETSAALLRVQSARCQMLSNVVFSQIKTHQKYGGIVPEVAAREHVQKIIPVIQRALKIDPKKIDLLAVTKGPGLITSLQVGVQTAKTLSYIWNKPLIGVNHIEAHLYSSWLTENLLAKSAAQLFPSVCLIVSGGHTELILIKGYGKYKLLGQTRDDAVGEAFDKVAKLLNLGYPGGPLIEKMAKSGKPQAIAFPRPMLRENSAKGGSASGGNSDFSFSGIKTSVRYYLDNLPKPKRNNSKVKQDVCASFQAAVTEVLVAKTIKAALKNKAKNIFIGGGVSANKYLTDELAKAAKKNKIKFYCPKFEYTQDNAAMIALAGYFNKGKASRSTWKTLTADPNLRIV